VDPPEETRTRLEVRERAVLQGLGQRFKRGERSPQFVREIADEVAADGFESSDARQILNKQEASARVRIGDGDELQKLTAGGQFHGFALQLRGLLATPPRVHEGMVSDGLGHRTSRERRAKKFFRGRVGKLDASVRIRDENAVGELVENGGEFGVLGLGGCELCAQYCVLRVA